VIKQLTHVTGEEVHGSSGILGAPHGLHAVPTRCVRTGDPGPVGL